MALKLLENPDHRDDPPRPLLEHLLALRDMFVFGAVAWAICVVLAAESRDVRNATAAKLLDFGFANYAAFKGEGGSAEIAVRGGVAPSCGLEYEPFLAAVSKGEQAAIKRELILPESVSAPIQKGDAIGEIVYRVGERELGRVPVVASHGVEKMNFGTLLLRMVARFLLK